jgi:DNA/RNA endonuclease G (NUC1)
MKNSLLTFIVLLACLSCSPPNRQHPHRIKQAKKESFKENHSASSSTLLHYFAFTVSYNPETLQPDWVSYTLTAEQVELTKHTPKIPRCFMPDPNLDLPQATNEDYSG